ncbi:phosphoribosylanthranilate isomerase [Desulfobaculum bizertense]|uniref:N-(5'-phosphoribosyl)anthranilate isomerase n=1 Tax=Desulfobaculum bizertense DSM 18034 TaxID=1121442 RepID=A0A1T4WT95_9BACT|nr:phosphoribosylanthranilate isomerase [Desulfobaculum bizertense]SKA80590.1 phosphoribosylanthranilate isomerase [Desulfobaculum bizertense DSM 18034]
MLVKICGMTSQASADLCQQDGVKMLGFIFHPSSPRNIEPPQARSIQTSGVLRVGVFVRQSAEDILRTMDKARLDIAQLAGNFDEELCARIGAERVMPVFRPEAHSTRQSLEQDLARYSALMRYALLDAGSIGGGHGRALNFSQLQGLISPVPWLLAGGLSPQNLGQALAEARPAGLDLNSGLEAAPGRKDPTKVHEALSIIRALDE